MVKRKQDYEEEEEDFDEMEEEDDEQEEDETPLPVKTRRGAQKKNKPKERFELVHQTELLGIRDNETGEIKRFSVEQEIVDIQNKLDIIIKGSGFD